VGTRYGFMSRACKGAISHFDVDAAVLHVAEPASTSRDASEDKVLDASLYYATRLLGCNAHLLVLWHGAACCTDARRTWSTRPTPSCRR